MSIGAAMLQRVARMESADAMRETLLVLAEQVAAEERRKEQQRERTRRHRDAKREGNVTVTLQQRDSNVTPPSKEGFPPPPFEETQPPQKGTLKGSQKGTPVEFDRFWAAYPKREGSNPKHPASLRFAAAVKAGTEPEAIISAAGRYAKAEGALGHIGTPYVKQAVAWLNQRCWEDYPEAASEATGPPQPPDPSMPSDAELRAKYTRLTEDAERDREPEDAPVLRGRDGLHREGQEARVDQARDARVDGMGDLPRSARRLPPGSDEGGREGAGRNGHDARPVAALVRFPGIDGGGGREAIPLGIPPPRSVAGRA